MNKAWHKLPNYNASIRWNGDATTPINDGEVLLPDGSIAQIQRISQQSMVKVKNGPLFTGSHHYLRKLPIGNARFETFDDLMERGLGLTAETPA